MCLKDANHLLFSYSKIWQSKKEMCLKGENHVFGVPNVYQSLNCTVCIDLMRVEDFLSNLCLLLKKRDGCQNFLKILVKLP